MKFNKKSVVLILPVLIFISFIFTNIYGEKARPSKLRFEISFPSSAHAEAITGRVFVMISENDRREPRLQAGSWNRSVPFFGLDIENLEPGEVIVIDENILGYPLKSLNEIPEGKYFAQGLVNIYTQFHRSDGHVIWAHMDQWEGQQFNRSPGNLYSEVTSVKLNPSS